MKKSTKRALGAMGLLAIAAWRHVDLAPRPFAGEPAQGDRNRSVKLILDRGQVSEDVANVRIGKGHQGSL